MGVLSIREGVMINKTVKQETLQRLTKIRGQVEGLMRMIDEEKYCIDIVSQSNAIRRAVEQVALLVMKRHIESCVADSMSSKETAKQKINELIESVDRFIR